MTKLCIPIKKDEGLASCVFGHFGSAPSFMLVDVDSGACEAVGNANQHHDHGRCSPLQALAGRGFDAIVVGGIGAGALSKLSAAGIPVYMAEHRTIAETIEAFKAQTLSLVDPNMACAHHGGQH
ncbi:MAG: NifB/NifX family molybdenum-iron cluster-binding protein [Deltaproteobacteria bacterium]|nr:NifB/NifX family molybdenum-iron cluster-binding protein [Deltaproteobacteria bacterium]